MLHSAKNHSQYKNKFHNRNDFYTIDNNSPVLDFIASNNLQNGNKSLSTFDFSTLYTSIPHHQLKDNLREFVEHVFDFKNKQFIIPNVFTKKAYFSNNKCKNKPSFSKDELIECLFYLIDNSYIKINNNIYGQVIGIPMGTNSGSQIANIYLYIYEYRYIKKLIDQNDEESLEKLRYIFRYQDDLISFNDFGLLEIVLQDIYPREMVVNKTSSSYIKCNYLDMAISICNGKFDVKLYDKRNDYNFNVISYPFLDGNIPKDRSHGIFISQLIRICKVNTNLVHFLTEVKYLSKKLIEQSFDSAALRKILRKFYYTKIETWGK